MLFEEGFEEFRAELNRDFIACNAPRDFLEQIRRERLAYDEQVAVAQGEHSRACADGAAKMARCYFLLNLRHRSPLMRELPYLRSNHPEFALIDCPIVARCSVQSPKDLMSMSM